MGNAANGFEPRVRQPCKHLGGSLRGEDIARLPSQEEHRAGDRLPERPQVQAGVATERRIQVGRRAADRIEVLSGIEPGAQVVLSPGNLRGGASVRLAR